MTDRPTGDMRGMASRVGSSIVERFEPRTRVRLQASLFVDHTSADACILDISSRGLMLETGHPLRVGNIVEVRHGQQSLVGNVKWIQGRRVGVRLGGRIAVQAFLRGDADFALVRPSPSRQLHHGAPNLAGIVDWIFRHFQWLVLVALVAVAAVVASEMVSKVLSPLDSIRLG